MSERISEREPDPRLLAELSALADGTLAPDRVERVRELIAASPDLGARYERERRAVLAVRSLTADRAPANLRFAIDVHRRRAPSRRARFVYGGALVATATLGVILLALLLPGGTPGSPTVSQAAALALRGSAMPAPARGSGGNLRVDVGELYFPDWSGWFGWRPSGERIDRLGGTRGKAAVTVFYVRGGRSIAYTILAAPPLRWPTSRMLHLDGIALESFTLHGRLVVTWRRNGHTCVLSGSNATVHELATLAAWKASGLS